jgi:hypothetical protein
MTNHIKPPRRGSALITTIIMSSIFLALLLVLFSFVGLLQSQIQRTIAATQLLSLGNGGLNHALARYRVDSTYTGEYYALTTGAIETFLGPVTTDPTKILLTVRAYVPNKTSPVRSCKIFRVVIDPAPTPAQAKVVKKTYEELNDPTCGG